MRFFLDKGMPVELLFSKIGKAIVEVVNSAARNRSLKKRSFTS